MAHRIPYRFKNGQWEELAEDDVTWTPADAQLASVLAPYTSVKDIGGKRLVFRAKNGDIATFERVQAELLNKSAATQGAATQGAATQGAATQGQIPPRPPGWVGPWPIMTEAVPADAMKGDPAKPSVLDWPGMNAAINSLGLAAIQDKETGEWQYQRQSDLLKPQATALNERYYPGEQYGGHPGSLVLRDQNGDIRDYISPPTPFTDRLTRAQALSFIASQGGADTPEQVQRWLDALTGAGPQQEAAILPGPQGQPGNQNIGGFYGPTTAGFNATAPGVGGGNPPGFPAPGGGAQTAFLQAQQGGGRPFPAFPELGPGISGPVNPNNAFGPTANLTAVLANYQATQTSATSQTPFTDVQGGASQASAPPQWGSWGGRVSGPGGWPTQPQPQGGVQTTLTPTFNAQAQQEDPGGNGMVFSAQGGGAQIPPVSEMFTEAARRVSYQGLTPEQYDPNYNEASPEAKAAIREALAKEQIGGSTAQVVALGKQYEQVSGVRAPTAPGWEQRQTTFGEAYRAQGGGARTGVFQIPPGTNPWDAATFLSETPEGQTTSAAINAVTPEARQAMADEARNSPGYVQPPQQPLTFAQAVSQNLQRRRLEEEKQRALRGGGRTIFR